MQGFIEGTKNKIDVAKNSTLADIDEFKNSESAQDEDEMDEDEDGDDEQAHSKEISC